MVKSSKSKRSRKITKQDGLMPPPPSPRKGMSLRAKLAIVIVVGIIIGVSVWAGTRTKPEDPVDPPIDDGPVDPPIDDGPDGEGPGDDGTGDDGPKKEPVGTGSVGAIVGGVAIFVLLIGGIVVLTHKEKLSDMVKKIHSSSKQSLDKLRASMNKDGFESKGDALAAWKLMKSQADQYDTVAKEAKTAFDKMQSLANKLDADKNIARNLGNEASEVVTERGL